MIAYLSLELKSPRPLPCLTDICVASSKAGLQLGSSTIEISKPVCIGPARAHRDNNTVHSVHQSTMHI